MNEPALPDAPEQHTLTLVSKNSLGVPSAPAMIAILALLFLAIAALAFFVMLQAGKQPNVGWGETALLFLAKVNWRAQLASVEISPAFLAKTATLIGFFLLLDRLKLERLILSPEGIRYVSPAPSWLKRFVPDWSLSWNEVTGIELGMHPVHLRNRGRPEFVVMSLIAAGERRKISPMLWVTPAKHTLASLFGLAFKGLARGAEDDLRKTISGCEVGRYLSSAQPHIPINWNLTVLTDDSMSSLEKNPHGKATLALLSVLMVYAFLDFILGPESYVDGAAGPGYLYVGAGIAAAGLSGLWLSQSSLKSYEKAGLAMLLGVVAAVAMIPGALRINQFLGGNELVSYNCHVIKAADRIILQPLAQGVPSVEYFARNEYWEKFGPGDLYPVPMRKGILGFYQFDSAAIRERMAAQ